MITLARKNGLRIRLYKCYSQTCGWLGESGRLKNICRCGHDDARECGFRKKKGQDMKQRVVMFEAADMDSAADGLERLLALDPAIDAGQRESYRSIIESLRHQLGSPKANIPVLNEVITAWTVEDIVDATRESGAGDMTLTEINAVAEKLSRNPEDMCWDRVYEEIGRLTADKGGQ
jgi:hypothetical protein